MKFRKRKQIPHNCILENRNSFKIKFKEENQKCPDLKWDWFNFTTVSPNHPLCGKFFRSQKAVAEEKKRQITSKYHYVIHPFSELR